MQLQILVQWIGHSDLRAMARDLPSERQQQVVSRVGGDPAQFGDHGPTKTLLQAHSFDEVRLLSNYPRELNQWFQDWVGVPVKVIEVTLENPTDYQKIYRIADAELGKLRESHARTQIKLNLHLSPGTPAMAAVWLLLGKTRYPATFFETFAGQSKITEVPFDLTVDVIPELLHAADRHWQHLTVDRPSEIAGFEQIIGESRLIREAVGRAKRVALRSVSALLLGESGTGKELFARAIHQASGSSGLRRQVCRSDNPVRQPDKIVRPTCHFSSDGPLVFSHANEAVTGADQETQANVRISV